MAKTLPIIVTPADVTSCGPYNDGKCCLLATTVNRLSIFGKVMGCGGTYVRTTLGIFDIDAKAADVLSSRRYPKLAGLHIDLTLQE